MKKKSRTGSKGPHLPKRPPKKTGKAGVGPKEDADAGKSTGGQQAELLKVEKQPTPAVQHDRMSAHFIGFSAKRTKNRERVVGMRFSLELQDEHEGRIPQGIEDEWKHFRRGSVKMTVPEGIGSQNVKLAISSDGAIDLAVVAAVPRAVISRITQKGKGASRKIIRLELHLLTAFTQDVEHFCRDNYDETVWLQLEESQRSFGEDEEAQG
jgi:hypothetical protein